MSADPTAPRLLTIDELNRLDCDELGPALKPLFEAAGPLAEALFEYRPFSSYEELIDRASDAVVGLTEEQKVRVVNAHPRIGAPPEMLRQTSLISYREQGYDRDDDQAQVELRRVLRELEELNQVYEDRFGFRFVVFVNRRPRAEILETLKQRLQNSREQELRTALAAMLAIARDRLRTIQG